MPRKARSDVLAAENRGSKAEMKAKIAKLDE
jgi:hypothetical protein